MVGTCKPPDVASKDDPTCVIECCFSRLSGTDGHDSFPSLDFVGLRWPAQKGTSIEAKGLFCIVTGAPTVAFWKERRKNGPFRKEKNTWKEEKRFRRNGDFYFSSSVFIQFHVQASEFLGAAFPLPRKVELWQRGREAQLGSGANGNGEHKRKIASGFEEDCILMFFGFQDFYTSLYFMFFIMFLLFLFFCF